MSDPLLLLVDDAPEIGLIVQRFARRAGQRVVILTDAESAWEYLQQATELPTLVILDLNLPGASGADLCRALRGAARFRALRVALFSHWERPQDIVSGLEAGANYVLSKDLLTNGEGWQQRLAEILRPPAGRQPAVFLAWIQTFSLDRRQLVLHTHEALRQAVAGPLDLQIARVLVRRACRYALPARAPNADHADWLAADGLGLDPDLVAADASAEAVVAFMTAIAEQMWCLLGTAASTAFWATLPADPTASEPPSSDERTTRHPPG